MVFNRRQRKMLAVALPSDFGEHARVPKQDTGNMEEMIARLAVTADDDERKWLREISIPLEMGELGIKEYLSTSGSRWGIAKIPKVKVRTGKDLEAQAWLKSLGYKAKRSRRKRCVAASRATAAFVEKIESDGGTLPHELLEIRDEWFAKECRPEKVSPSHRNGL